MTVYEQKFAHIQPVAEGHIFPLGENSFKQFINQCHPDVRRIIGEDLKKIKSDGHGIEVITNNGLRIVIKVISNTKQAIKVFNKREKVFEGISEVLNLDNKPKSKPQFK